MDGSELLRLARDLCRKTGEAEWRCSASRSYYAAFHVTREFLQELGFETPRAEQAHAYLWRRLQSCGGSSVGTAGRQLQNLRSLRNRADYDLTARFTQLDAERGLDDANAVVQFLSQLTVEDRQAALEVMKTYERDVLRETTWRPKPR